MQEPVDTATQAKLERPPHLATVAFALRSADTVLLIDLGEVPSSMSASLDWGACVRRSQSRDIAIRKFEYARHCSEPERVLGARWVVALVRHAAMAIVVSTRYILSEVGANRVGGRWHGGPQPDVLQKCRPCVFTEGRHFY